MTNGEQWRAIPETPGYEASSLGRIRSCWIVGGAHNRGRRMGDRWRVLKGWGSVHGYRHVNVLSREGNQTPGVHILIAEAFHGPRPEGLEVRHLNGIKTDNRPENLRWGTRTEQRLDDVRNGQHGGAIKTHCPREHPYSEDNTYVIPKSGGRTCRTCKRLRDQAKRLQSAGLAS